MDNPQNKQIDRTNMTTEQIAQLDSWQHAQDQLQTLKDIAAMMQEVVHLFDEYKTEDSTTDNKMGVLLVDIRDTLGTLNDKEIPDTSAPIIKALDKLQTAFSKAISSIDVKPNVNIDAPNVNVTPTPVDFSGIEKILQIDLPKAFNDAIKAIPAPERPDYSPLLDAWAGISEQLLSIENATRMKPLPGSMKVTSLNGATETTLASVIKSEDAGHLSGDKGIPALAVRNDSGAVLATSDLDYIPIATDATGAIRVDLNGTISTNNSSTVVLSGGAVFTGTWEDVLNYNEIRVSAIASHVSAADGLSIQQSSDGVNIDFTDVYTIAAATGKTYSVPRQARYYRVVYTNGATLQTSFRLQTLLNRLGTKASSQRPSDGYTNETDLEQEQSFLMGYNGATWDRLRSDTPNGLDVDVTRVASFPGVANLAHGQVALSSSATQVVSTRATRRAVTIVNLSTTDIYVGNTGVTTSTGQLLLGSKGAAITIETVTAVFAIVTTGTPSVSYLEEYA